MLSKSVGLSLQDLNSGMSPGVCSAGLASTRRAPAVLRVPLLWKLPWLSEQSVPARLH